MYKFIYALLNVIFLPFISMKFENEENIPKDRNYIIVANHVSNFDPLLLALKWKKPVHFMAKEELFKIFLIGRVLKMLDMIPVRRGESDRKAIKESLDYLNKGEILALFPEGTRNKLNGDLLPFHTGAAFFAKNTGLEVLPVAITGTNKIKISFLNKVNFKIGEAKKIEDYFQGKITSKELEGFTDILRKDIERLLEVKDENN